MTDSLKPSTLTKVCKQFFVNENSCAHLKQSMLSYYVELELKIPIKKNTVKLLIIIYPPIVFVPYYNIVIYIYTVTSVSAFVHCQDFRHLHPQKSMFTLSC